MWRTFWIVAGCIGAVVGGLVWHGTTQATFLFHHPRTASVRVEIDRRTGAAVVRPKAQAAVAVAAVAPGAQPRVVAEHRLHDFGTMDPLTMGSHEFVVKNSGAAPLALRVGPTTCKCTVSNLSNSTVPPGGSTTVRLEWNTGRDERYEHAGTIFTNDPTQKSIDLRVVGKVRLLIGCDQKEIVLEALNPSAPAVIERVIYSQTLDAFTITRLDSTISGLTWSAEPADPATLPALSPKHAQRLRIAIPSGSLTGIFTDTLRLSIQPPGESSEPLTLELPLAGSVARRLAFYGPMIDSAGVIDLGDVQEGHSAKAQLLAKVRDIELNLPQAKAAVFPSFLSARFEPAGKPGLYSLTVELPDNVPPCQYQSDPIGWVRIDTGHPRIGTVELKVTFAVVPRRSL